MANLFNKKEKSGSAAPSPQSLAAQVAPKGQLLHLRINQIKHSPDNPRKLFDPSPLSELRDSIRAHGVLVPLTVYKLSGQDRYAIVDGERRFRCCQDLSREGVDVSIPANIVEPPDKLASLIYMFNIHSFREQWELMPTALGLQKVIDAIGSDDSRQLHEVTGLSLPQIERCKTILKFPIQYQNLSLLEDAKDRIPSNFWIELFPVLEIAEKVAPDLYSRLGRDGITDLLVEKYKAKKIKSVIHFRRIIEAFDAQSDEEDEKRVAAALKEYITSPKLETRAVFDSFIQDARRIQKAVGACDQFLADIRKAKVAYSIEEKDELIAKLKEVMLFAKNLVDKLEGEEPPAMNEEAQE